MNEARKFTALDSQLMELALTDWQQFVQLIGINHITAAKVCLLRRQGKSYEQIAQKLSIPKHRVEYSCVEKCQEKSDVPKLK